ncbi:EF-P beta-lysylation protein EpmB [Agarilytica rhodophyticola]|uniref:EF-P beta-lysylation protein EpmB n=1 Tax=Agarilytica rhodophyticola TaxID=1737490 RepID=UPI000B347C58|nr:EF-P beta-lysylation protein EpmB [Agarilytica rhodophyticola]
MIPRTIPTWQTKSWQEELSDLITQPEELFSLLNLPAELLPAAQKAHTLFPLRSTRAYVSRIQQNNPDDPLLKQILPLGEELIETPDFVDDPLEEEDFTPVPGLIHKYHGRVLLIAANQCAINCRYCFRRHFDYQQHALSRQQWQQALDYISNNKDVEEVILSGGDPLAVSDRQLSWLVAALAEIPHVERLRIHSRIPIVAPSRITEELLATLKDSGLLVSLVIHCNHPQEIDEEVAAALTALKNSGIILLNQSVVLKGVNDTSETLITLSKKLFQSGVLPYYLHLLDKVKGSSHFTVNEVDVLSLNRTLLANLPGYLVPKFVKEVPNAPSKVPII